MSACGTSASSKATPTARFAEQHLHALVALGPRVGETEAATLAATYIHTQLATLKVSSQLEPLGTVELPAISVMGTRYRLAQNVTSTDNNIVARFGPPAAPTNPALLLMAHYDSVTGSPGAADNAAAVAVLLQLAAELAAAPPSFPLLIAFTAREEDGLVGAEALVKAHGDSIGFAIALDLLGTDGKLTLTGAGTLLGRRELQYLATTAQHAHVKLDAPVPHRIISRWWPQAERSDHGPFTRRGIRAVQLYHRGHNGEFIDLAYHTPFDQVERISAARLSEILQLLRSIVTTAPPGVGIHQTPVAVGDAGWWIPDVMGRWVASRRMLVAGCWSLVAATLLLLLTNRRSHVAAMPKRFGLSLSLAAFALATGLTLLVEKSASYAGAWTLAPRLYIAASSGILLGGTALIITALGRRWQWHGERRFLYAAVSIQLTLAVTCLVIGAAELAPLWLGAALLLAVAPRLGRHAWLAVAMAAYPLWFLFDGARLREMIFHRFVPSSLPISLWVAFHLGPMLLAGAYLLRARHNRQPRGPLRAFLLPTTAFLTILVGIAAWVIHRPTCSAEAFALRNLACEMTEPEVREKPHPHGP
ncbi:MAG: M28 family peptidase [Kofleriaceae bacterium]|nr:M28 family peptidase [Kofleriaceae bacterium]